MMWTYVDEKLPTPGKLVEVSVVVSEFCYVALGWMNKNGRWYDDATYKLFEDNHLIYAYRDYSEPTPAPLKKDK